MNFGDCPYCDDFTGFHKVPDKTPCYAKVNCESCGKEFWYRLSRIDPQAWTIEDFENEFDIDFENNKIKPKGEKMSKTLTCVYCGMAYPEGTPPHGAQILTDHIKVCEKHPMREAEAMILKLRNALAGLVGASTKEELKSMEFVLRSTPAPDADKAVMINAIHILIETAD